MAVGYQGYGTGAGRRAEPSDAHRAGMGVVFVAAAACHYGVL